MPDAVGEDLRPAARHRIDSRFLHLLQGLFDGHLAALGEKGDFDHGERLNVDFGEANLEAAYQVHEVGEGQIGVQAADNVELGHGFGVTRGCRLPRLFKRHRVGSGVALLAAEGAEAA